MHIGAVRIDIEQYLVVYKYLMVSVGRMEVSGQETCMLLEGVLDHVLTVSEKQLEEHENSL